MILAPVPPIRGGIAKHTEELVAHLSGHYKCTVLADSRLYPRALYPGKSQLHEETSSLDPEDINVVSSRFRHLLWRLVVQKRENLAGIILVWWTPALAHKFALAAIVARVKKIQVVAFCHNVAPHENTRLSSAITRWSLRIAKKFMVQTESDAALLSSALGSKATIRTVPHPPYKALVSGSKRNALPTPQTFLFFGIIRPYKGVSTLLEAVDLCGTEEFSVRIVGESWDSGLTKQIRASEKRHAGKVSARLDFVSDAALTEEIAKADFVVIPYLSASGSGVLALAKAHKKPVIISDLTEFENQVVDEVDGYFFRTGSARSLAAMITRATANHGVLPMEPWKNLQTEPSWDDLANEIKGLLED